MRLRQKHGSKKKLPPCSAAVKGSGQTVKVDNINQPRMLSTYVLIYNSKSLNGDECEDTKPENEDNCLGKESKMEFVVI